MKKETKTMIWTIIRYIITAVLGALAGVPISEM